MHSSFIAAETTRQNSTCLVAHWHSIVAELTFEARVAKISAHP